MKARRLTQPTGQPVRMIPPTGGVGVDVRRPYVPRPRCPGGTKDCPACNRVLHVSEFGVHRSRPGGLSVYCRSCKAEKAREYDRVRRREYRARNLGRERTKERAQNARRRQAS